MATSSYSVERIAGLKKSDRRAITFLRGDDDQINARTVFKALDKDTERKVLSRFDYWIDFGVNNNWFHGWPNHEKYKECFVFKWKKGRLNHRLYGFLCNPQPKGNCSFRLCVLCSHSTKQRWETDPRELDGANALRLNPAVLAAIQLVFPDTQTGVRQWLN